MLANVLKALPNRPTHAIVCWDGPVSKTKKPRGPKPPGFVEDRACFERWWPGAMGGTHLTAPAGLEADDLCACAAKQFCAEFDSITVVSADKDLHQVVTDKVHIFDPGKRVVVDAAFVCNKWGVQRPAHMAAALAMIGDPNDGIPGVTGIGKGKAPKVLAEHAGKDLLGIYEALADRFGAEFTEAFDAVFLKTGDFVVPEPTEIALGAPRGFIDSDGELAWRRLKIFWASPPVKLEEAMAGFSEAD